jgi:hypothetical protein
MAPTNPNSAPAPHTAHSMPTLRASTVAWRDCSVSEMGPQSDTPEAPRCCGKHPLD